MSSLFDLTGKPHLSYSALTDYVSCGEKFRLARIERVPQGPAVWFAGGTAVHEAVEAYEHCLHNGIDPTAAATTARTAFTEALVRELEAEPEGAEWQVGGRKTKQAPRGEDFAWWRVNGLDMVANYIRWRNASPLTLWVTPEGSLAAEVGFNVTLPGDIPYVGKIDLIMQDPAGNLVVIDVKTGQRVPVEDQLGTYAVAMEMTWGIRPSYGAYYMARQGSLSGLVGLDHFSIDRLGRWARDTRKGIEAGVFLPHRTGLCNTCSVRDHCYAYTSDVTPDFTSDLEIPTTTEGSAA